jgi:hypothetical protein
MTPRSGPPARRALVPVAAALALTATALIPTVWSSSSAHAATAPVTVLYKTSTSTVSDEVDPWFELVNNTSSAIPYSSLKIDYYFSDPSNETYDFACAWAVVSCADLTGTVAPLATASTKADHYLQISFSAAAGSLAPGANSGDMELRMWRADWADINQANDYSYVGTDTSYTASNQVTAFQNGNLVWGVEPNGTTANPTGSTSPSSTPDRRRRHDPAVHRHPVRRLQLQQLERPEHRRARLDRAHRRGRPGRGRRDLVGERDHLPGLHRGRRNPRDEPGRQHRRHGRQHGPVGDRHHVPKFLNGTYAAKVYFNDAPTTGPNGDDVNETFYTISPLSRRRPELQRGRLRIPAQRRLGRDRPTMYTTTWYTLQQPLDSQDNSSTSRGQPGRAGTRWWRRS